MNYFEKLKSMTITAQEKNDEARRDPLRTKYHAIAPSGWLNDPNGFSIFGNEYQLYYQHNPLGVGWNNICWGHLSSIDLVHWKHQPLAIAPGEEYDKDGTFSGSAVEYGGKLYAYYTGNRYLNGATDPYTEEMKQVQCLAVGTPNLLEKHPANPIITAQPPLLEKHFRDPRVWMENGTFYMIVGGTDGSNSHIPLYTSTDGVNWSFKSMLFKGNEGSAGFMWECPDFFALGSEYLLMGCPMKLQSCEESNKALYIIGEYCSEAGSFTPKTNLQEFDKGFSYYAPQTVKDLKDRRIIIGWIPPVHGEVLKGCWFGTLSLPRQLVMANGYIEIHPIPELRELRSSKQNSLPKTIFKPSILFEGQGNHYELELSVELTQGSGMCLGICCNRDGERGLSLKYNGQTLSVTLGNKQRSWELHKPSSRLDLDVFVDGCTVEIFINNGDSTFTACIAAPKEQDVIYLQGTGEIQLVQASLWQMKDIGI